MGKGLQFFWGGRVGLNNYCHVFISHFLLLDMVHTTVASPWPISSSYWHMGIACEPPQPQFETLVAVFFDSILWIWEIKTQRYREWKERVLLLFFSFFSLFLSTKALHLSLTPSRVILFNLFLSPLHQHLHHHHSPLPLSLLSSLLKEKSVILVLNDLYLALLEFLLILLS